MKNKNGFLFVLLMMFMLTACNTAPKYTYIPPRSCLGKMCITGCMNKRTHCRQMCDVHKIECAEENHERAYYRYIIHHDEQLASNKPNVKKFIMNFDDSLCCNNLTCNCEINFNQCYLECGGMIIKDKKIY